MDAFLVALLVVGGQEQNHLLESMGESRKGSAGEYLQRGGASIKELRPGRGCHLNHRIVHVDRRLRPVLPPPAPHLTAHLPARLPTHLPAHLPPLSPLPESTLLLPIPRPTPLLGVV